VGEHRGSLHEARPRQQLAQRGGGTWIAVMGHSKPILCDYCEFFNFARAFHNDVTILSQNNSKFSNVVRLL
jgi:hypothetical protein